MQKADTAVPADTAVIAAVPSVWQLGPVEVVRATAAGLPRSAAGHARETIYSFVLQVCGQGHLRHYGHESMLGSGDCVLINTCSPHVLAVSDPGEVLMLRVPLGVLRSYLPSPEQFCGRHLRAGDGIADSAADLALGICDQLEAGIPLAFRHRVARNLLDMLATAFSVAHAGTLAGSPVLCSRNARVRLYVEQHLRDPELRPSAIASRLGLSPRYLRLIFAASNETVSAYILRRRLEECFRDLADPRLIEVSITEIAFGWGFNSAPHFTRSFRDRYGITPRDHRRARAPVAH